MLNCLAKAQVLVANGTVRFTVLTPSLVRIESITPNEDGSLPPFDEYQTQVVVNRLFPVPEFTTATSGMSRAGGKEMQERRHILESELISI